MTASRFPDAPARIARLRVSDKGFPIPWFVAADDFRVAGQAKVYTAVQRGLCWICGEPLGRWHAYLIGPMCVINRVSAEPPSHRECAEFSACSCPFLSSPLAVRNERTPLPEGAKDQVPGIGIPRNPGCCCVWITRDPVRPFPDPNGRPLFDIGKPSETLWFAAGRQARHSEVLASVESGMPVLRALAASEGPKAEADLDRQCLAALPIFTSIPEPV